MYILLLLDFYPFIQYEVQINQTNVPNELVKSTVKLILNIELLDNTNLSLDFLY